MPRKLKVEELGAEPKIGRLLYVQQFALEDDDQDILEFFFHIENPEDYQNVDLGKTTHGEKEIAAVDFVAHSFREAIEFIIRTATISQKDCVRTERGQPALAGAQ